MPVLRQANYRTQSHPDNSPPGPCPNYYFIGKFKLGQYETALTLPKAEAAAVTVLAF